MAVAEQSRVTTKVQEIGPAKARKLLANNTHNRNLADRRVEQLAGAMRRGEWVFNGDAIRVSEDGVLLDGQHRLAAIMRAEMPQKFLVVSGLPAAAQETMDSGAKRGVGDVLKLRGEKNVFRLAAAVRNVNFYETTGTMRPTPPHPTTQQIVATLDRHPAIREAIKQANPVRINTQFAGGPAGACYYLFSLVDPTDTEIFFTRLAHGTDLLSGDPIHALRRQFTNPRPTGNTIRAYIQAALCIRAFNHWRAGTSLTHLVWRPGGGSKEKFPVIEGLEL